MKRIGPLVLSAFLLSATVGCSPQVEPIAIEILQKKLGVLELVSEELVPNCGASYGIPCQQPLYSAFFAAGPTEEPEDICTPVVQFQNELGLDAYSAEGASEIALTKNLNEVIDFCVEGLETNLGPADGPSYYEGTILYEDGSEDRLVKVTVISRRDDGSYFVDFSISRDTGRIGYFEIQGEPKHRLPD